jgi:large subunit ribosomal protein L15
LWQRRPKERGEDFIDPWRVNFTPVNLKRIALADFPEGAEVTPQSLADAGIIQRPDELVVILARGELEKPLVVKAHRFSKSARAKIEAAGGTIEELPWERGGHRTR